MATTDMTMITDTPITREEVAMLFTGSVKAQAEIVNQFKEEIHNYFSEQLSQSADTFSKLVDRNERLAMRIEAALDNQQQQTQDALTGFAAVTTEKLKHERDISTELKKYLLDQKQFMSECLRQQVASSTRTEEYQKEAVSKIKDLFNFLPVASQANETFARPINPEPRLENKVVRPMLDKSSLKAWKQDIWKVLDAIAPKYGVGAPMVCSYVYQKMRSKYGVDVDALFANRKNRDRDTSKMLMCMHDARLGQKFEEALLDLYCEAMEKTPAVKKPQLPGSLIAQRIPENIRMSCRALYPNLSDKLAINRVYRKMEQISGLNLAKYIDTHRKDIEYKQFSKAYFVSRDKKLMSYFNRAIKELREG